VHTSSQLRVHRLRTSATVLKKKADLPDPGNMETALIKEKETTYSLLRKTLTKGPHLPRFLRTISRSLSDIIAASKPINCSILLPAWEMDVEVIWGSTGTGKSRYCLETYPDAWWKSKNSGQQQFWDGYMGEDTIIIDEFYGWFSWDYLLRLLDRYPFSLDTKHGTIQCSAKKIVLTSNKHPKDWYQRPSYLWDDTNPLKRRIKSITHLGEVQSTPPDSPKDLQRISEEFDWVNKL